MLSGLSDWVSGGKEVTLFNNKFAVALLLK